MPSCIRSNASLIPVSGMVWVTKGASWMRRPSRLPPSLAAGCGLDAAEGRAQPAPAGDQLERPGADFLPRACHADDHALTPAAVRAFQRGTHHIHVADALEAVVHAPGRHVDDDLLDGLVVVLGVDAVGGAKGAGQVELGGVGVDGDDAPRLGQLGALDHRQPDAAQAEYGHAVALLHLSGVLDGAKAGGHAAAQQAHLLGVGIGADLGQRDLGHHRVLAERAAAHVVVDRLAVVAEPRGAVGHHALALGGAHGHAQVGLAALAEQAFAAFGGVQRNHVVARLHAGHAFAALDHDAGALMAQHGREQALRIVARECEGIGVAHAGVRDLHQHLALLRRCHVDLDDLQGLAGLEGHGSTGFHQFISSRFTDSASGPEQAQQQAAAPAPNNAAAARRAAPKQPRSRPCKRTPCSGLYRALALSPLPKREGGAFSDSGVISNNFAPAPPHRPAPHGCARAPAPARRPGRSRRGRRIRAARWPSSTSAIRPLTTPRRAASCCSSAPQAAPSATLRSSAPRPVADATQPCDSALLVFGGMGHVGSLKILPGSLMAPGRRGQRRRPMTPRGRPPGGAEAPAQPLRFQV